MASAEGSNPPPPPPQGHEVVGRQDCPEPAGLHEGWGRRRKGVVLSEPFKWCVGFFSSPQGMVDTNPKPSRARTHPGHESRTRTQPHTGIQRKFV